MRKLLLATRVALIIALCVVTQGQTKPPTSVRLNTEASQRFLEVVKARQELFLRDQELQQRQVDLMAAAGVPENDREHWLRDKDGSVVFVHQEAVRASTEKK